MFLKKNFVSLKKNFWNLMKWGLKEGISIDADSGPPRYVLWCCGGICHQLLTFFQIGCSHTVGNLPKPWAFKNIYTCLPKLNLHFIGNKVPIHISYPNGIINGSSALCVGGRGRLILCKWVIVLSIWYRETKIQTSITSP